MTGKKNEPLLHLDMDFNEAFQRFANTDKKEVDASIKRAKKKKPPEATTSDGRQTSDENRPSKDKR